MSLAPGTRVGPYEVVEAIGAGGMGEVLRARDTRLGRDVALKVLPRAALEDEGRRARFEREARLLAALSHPNIAQVYGVEDSEAGPAIAMELVEGRTVAELIAARGAVSWGEALPIARQIAEALDAAHERGIVHRDLKPANIKITPDGTVKVLDFGLAKPIEGVGSFSGESTPSTPTMTSPAMTEFGTVVGTAAYMSPEQARGDAVDRRTDIWAFGCVLFELLAGRRAFAGPTASDVIAAVLEREPDWSRLPADTPETVRRVLRRCLAKSRRTRQRDIADAAAELADGAEHGDGVLESSGTRMRARGPVTVLTAIALALAATVIWLVADGNRSAAPGLAARLSLPPPPESFFGSTLSYIETTTVSFAPDGRRLAFVATRANQPSRVWIRPLGEPAARELPDTDGATSVFWSPDGAQVAFFAAGRLKRVAAAGGSPVTICDVPVNVGLSGTWGADGVILFATVQGEGIFRTTASGGTAQVLASPAPSPERRLVWPRFLPDGRRFLYTTLGRDNTGELRIVDANGRERTLVEARSNAQWIEPDWLVFTREGALLAQRMDLTAGRAVGEPVSIAGPLAYSAATGWSNVTASPNGMVAFQWADDESRLAWISGAGAEVGTVGAPGPYLYLRLTRDGSAVLFDRTIPTLGTRDVWIADLDRPAERPVTSSPAMEFSGVWLPDGSGLVYAGTGGGPPNLRLINLATGADRQVGVSPRYQSPNDVSRDGALVVFQQRSELGNFDLMLTSLSDPPTVTTLVATPFSEFDGRVSPDGRWLAFTSNESGRNQVHLTTFPVPGRARAVSVEGGGLGRWSRDGRELFFVSASGVLMSVSIDGSGAPGLPRARFPASGWLDFDVAPDGRFLANVTTVVARRQPLSVILNWPVDR